MYTIRTAVSSIVVRHGRILWGVMIVFRWRTERMGRRKRDKDKFESWSLQFPWNRSWVHFKTSNPQTPDGIGNSQRNPPQCQLDLSKRNFMYLTSSENQSQLQSRRIRNGNAMAHVRKATRMSKRTKRLHFYTTTKSPMYHPSSLPCKTAETSSKTIPR